jgi:hypothetical protein
MSTAEQRQEWARLAEAATPGEWRATNEVETRGNPFAFYLFVAADDIFHTMCGGQYESHSATANALFIAASRAAVPALLADVDRLTQFAARICAIVDDNTPAIGVTFGGGDGMTRYNMSRVHEAAREYREAEKCNA